MLNLDCEDKQIFVNKKFSVTNFNFQFNENNRIEESKYDKLLLNFNSKTDRLNKIEGFYNQIFDLFNL